jgi:hypothetical protein
MIKGALFLLGAVATIAAAAGTYETELLRGIDIYNFRSKCWGKQNVDKYALLTEKAKRECMQMEPSFDFPGHGHGPQNPFLRPNNNPFEKLTKGGDFSDLQSLWRSKRDASEGLLDVDEDDFYEYLQQVNDHKHFKHNAMGNLTCVLQKTGQLTEDMEINMDWYAAALRAEEPETGFTWDAEGAAATDPEWREKIATAYEDCHELAESWPATSLNRRPMTRMFGRQMIFFKCADRTERRVCTEAQLLENLETFYGSQTDEETAEQIAAVGLPEDKYDAAAISIAVLQNAQSEEEKFVERFLWNIDGDSSM